MHEGFVDLALAIPGLRVDARYATCNNLTGAPLDGYRAGRALATREAAQALASAFAAARSMGLGMLVFDAYRPQKAVDCFVRWSRLPEDNATRDAYYPALERTQLFPLGYIALKSGHTRGSTIDLTLLDAQGFPLDMGGSFDLMDDISHHGAAGLTPEQAGNRALLCRLMTDAGFLPYENEWWHYRLADEPYPDACFDFDIEPISRPCR